MANKTLFIKNKPRARFGGWPIYSLTPSVHLLQKPMWKNMKFVYEDRTGKMGQMLKKEMEEEERLSGMSCFSGAKEDKDFPVLFSPLC